MKRIYVNPAFSLSFMETDDKKCFCSDRSVPENMALEQFLIACYNKSDQE